jgi:hypothetical protein
LLRRIRSPQPINMKRALLRARHGITEKSLARAVAADN